MSNRGIGYITIPISLLIILNELNDYKYFSFESTLIVAIIIFVICFLDIIVAIRR